MGYSIIAFLIPPYSLIPLGLLLGIGFAAVYLGKAIFRLRREDIANPKGSLVSAVFAMWGVCIGAMYVSLIAMMVISNDIPLFQGVHSEWGIAFENAYGPARVYIACWMLLYAALQLPNLLIVKKRLLRGRGAFFSWHMLFSTVIFAVLLYLAYGLI